MKVYISADMEGATGVTHSQDVIPGRERYDYFRNFLTSDVNAAIAGASEAGATEFLINEAHDGMRNLLLDRLDPRAEVIVGNRKPHSMMQGFEDFDIAFFVGYHARAGVEGILSHTFSSPTEVVNVELNGEPCSEARMNAVLAATKGIPVGLVTGDDIACAEAESLYTGVKTACVKTAINRYTARCLSPEKTCSLIKEAASDAVRDAEGLEPYTVESPYTFTIEFVTASTAADVMYFPELKRLDDRIVTFSHEDYRTAFGMFVGVMRLARSDPDYG